MIIDIRVAITVGIVSNYSEDILIETGIHILL